MGLSTKNTIGLDGRTWLKYSVSVWDDIRKSPQELKLNHPAMFPTMLCSRLIEIFSHESDLVLDPFAGSGSTLLAASALDRRSLGIELSPAFIDLYKRRLQQTDIFNTIDSALAKMKRADARNLAKYVEPNSVRLTITSPPYWDILNQKRTADGKNRRNYGNTPSDLGNVTDYSDFFAQLREIFELVYRATQPNGYCCVIVMDIRKGDKCYPLHMDIQAMMADIGFALDDIIIWNRKQEYNNLRPLGYPSVFRVNKVHEFILIFRKRD